ncbi:arf-GAP domain and FG repeat-containing protein 1 isoform X3 [Phyllostomus discolor]|uniref:Arf-GAP domain and FG repeat-containing protein 1 isoform X3 n=1 Tax=Phyllostomus discolor TaxID=89673 RepID=A0A7E6DI27_9CHIR|nr:arf-GAP domain and FG repeat-containing protein 1 isoform X3 [Phyllostomus discolor]
MNVIHVMLYVDLRAQVNLIYHYHYFSVFPLLGPSRNSGLRVAAVTPPGQQGAPADSWPPAARGGPSLAVPFSRLFPTGEVGKVAAAATAAAAAAAAVVVPAGPVGVAGQPAPRSARAAPSPVQASDGGQVPGGRRSLTEGGGGGQGGPWDRGPPARRRPAPGPAGLLPRRRGHGGQREAEAGGEAPEDAAGHDRPPAQPKVLRLRPARPHLREHDGRLLRLHLLLGQPVCKQIWLGLFDDRSSAIPDFRDPQKVKEFLQEKYEKKRWYVPPEQAKVVASVHASISGSSASSTSSTPEVKPLKSLLGDSAPALHLNKGTPSQSPVVGRSQGQQQEKKQFDLLSDLGSDIFAAPAPQSTATANFANFAHFNSHAAQNSANADFANFDAFGQSSGSSNFGGFPTASHSPFQPQTTGGSAGSVNANFAHFDNFPKSSSADFGAFNASQSRPAAAAAGKVSANKAGLQTADKYAALANLDNIFSAGQGGDQGSGFGTTGKAPVGSVVSVPSQSSASSDKYAALAELDSVFSSAATSSNAYTSTSNASSNVFGTVPVGAPAQTQPAASSVPAPFGATPSTNPFVAAAGPSVASSTNPFQTSARGAAGLSGAMHSQVFPHAHFAATFGTASMSMPTGFGTPAPYSLPTSFSGSFQQPAFPAQAAFPQQTAFPQQPNGAGFAAFGQTKPVVTPFGQVAAAGVSSNPFMTGAPTGQFPTGSSSTNPFL